MSPARARPGRTLVAQALGVAMLLACAPRVVQAQDQSAVAEQVYLRAVELYAGGRPADALVQFRASLALHESPNTRLGIARCLVDLRRLGEAAAEYQRTVHEAEDLAETTGRYARTRDAARDELAALAPRVGWLVVQSPGVSLDDLRVEARELPVAALGVPISVTAGAVDVAARAGGRRARARAHVAPGARVTLVLDFGAASPTPGVTTVAPVSAVATVAPRAPLARVDRGDHRGDARASRTLLALGIGALGLGALGGATAVVFGVLAESEYRGLRGCEGDPPTVCPASEADKIERGRRDEMVANVGLAVGLVGAVAGVAGLVAGVTLRPRAVRVALGPAGVVVSGAF